MMMMVVTIVMIRKWECDLSHVLGKEQHRMQLPTAVPKTAAAFHLNSEFQELQVLSFSFTLT